MKKNIEQEKAIAQLEGPVILISCPGSGKTTTLLRRINHMLEVGIPPKKILMITFTKAAAQEMSVKFKKKFGEPNGITFSTIHALCLKILMTYGGLSAENIIKTSDQWKFLLETARKCQSVCDPAKAAGNFQMLYSAAMNNRMSPSEVNPKDIKGISRKDFLFMSEEYRRMKERTGYIDFDDMLVKAYELMTGNLQVLRQLRERWGLHHRLQRGIYPAGFPGYPYITGRGGRGKAAVLCCSHKGKGKIIYHLCREQKRQTGIPFRQGASAQGKRTG